MASAQDRPRLQPESHSPEPQPSEPQSEPLLETAAEIRHGANRLSRRLRAERSPDALSVNKLSVLSHLYHNGPTTPGRLAAAEHQRPQSLTRVFAELEQLGLIARSSGSQDRRQAVLTLTAAGLRALADDMAERDAWLAAALAGLSETERELLRLAARVMDRLADADPGYGPRPGPGPGPGPAVQPAETSAAGLR
jgi:DNA-binding MarR family transcriptional regulator